MTLPMNSFHLTLGIAAAALTALGTIAAAQPTPDQQSAIRSNCRSDFMSKCSGVPRGGKEALECLQKNVASLSPACKTAVSVTIPAPAQAAPPPAATPPAPKPAAAAAPPPAAAAAITPAAPPKAAVAKPAVATPSPPAVKPVATPAVAAVPPPAKPAPQPKPANAAPPLATTAAPPAAAKSGKPQTPFVPGSALIAKACARYLLMHCREVEPGSGRAVACLNDYIKAGNFVGPRCQTALKLTAPLR